MGVYANEALLPFCPLLLLLSAPSLLLLKLGVVEASDDILPSLSASGASLYCDSCDAMPGKVIDAFELSKLEAKRKEVVVGDRNLDKNKARIGVGEGHQAADRNKNF